MCAEKCTRRSCDHIRGISHANAYARILANEEGLLMSILEQLKLRVRQLTGHG